MRSDCRAEPLAARRARSQPGLLIPDATFRCLAMVVIALFVGCGQARGPTPVADVGRRIQIAGMVRDLTTDSALTGAQVFLSEQSFGSVERTQWWTIVDSVGRFVFVEMPRISYHMRVRSIGYTPRDTVVRPQSASEWIVNVRLVRSGDSTYRQ